MKPTGHLAQLRALLGISRAGELFPDRKRLLEWLDFAQRPGPKGAPQKLELDPRSGFPSRDSLGRLLQQQQVAREFLAAHGEEGDRASSRFSLALAAAELPTLSSVTAKLVGWEGNAIRFKVTHDRLDPETGCPVRYTLALTQRDGQHLWLERGDLATPTDAFRIAVERACWGSGAQQAARMIGGLAGLVVTELVRTQLGPFVTAQSAAGTVLAPLGPLLDRGAGSAVLTLCLDRAGETVTASRSADPLRPEPEAGTPFVARERRFVCTPELAPALKAWVASRQVAAIVRSA